jgi:regulator of replication initiation timing
MLHFKMEALMKKYQSVREAFTTIKQETNVREADRFVRNYLNKDQIYGDLLESISTREPKIEELKDEKNRLSEEQRHL